MVAHEFPNGRHFGMTRTEEELVVVYGLLAGLLLCSLLVDPLTGAQKWFAAKRTDMYTHALTRDVAEVYEQNLRNIRERTLNCLSIICQSF